jgi:long-chain-fatty-acid--CoA ligase ACSBG
MEALKEIVNHSPNRAALASKVGDSWSFLTFEQYYQKICCTAKAFIKAGLEPYHGVGILGFNSPEWFFSSMGAIFAGGMSIGIYTTNSPEACHYVLNDAECQIAVVENDFQLRKILAVRDRLPHLKTIVQYKGQPMDDCPDVLSWEALMALGESKDEELETELQKRITAQAPNKCCSIVYTSGTTGNPKGVMTSHDGLTWTARSVSGFLRMSRESEHRFISYLPLSHSAAQMADLYGPLFCGGTVYFAQPDALRGTLKNTLTEVRPTVFFGVPRIWEKMQEGIVNSSRTNGTVKQWIVDWAMDIGLRSNLANMRQLPRPMLYPLAKALIFDKVRAALGFDQCQLFLSGAAPVSSQIVEFFLSLDMPIVEGYGLSETTAPHTFGTPWDNSIKSVGREIPGVTTLLADADKEITGEGEICTSGRNVMMGYLNQPDKTKEAIDDEGWFHTGDIGRKDENGFLYITGRIKELIITAGGENIPPVAIEDKVKETLPCISNCMLIGDKRKFLTMLLTFKTEVDKDTMEPTERLTPAAIDWCCSVGSSATTVADIVDQHDPKVMEAIQKGIDIVNKKATSRAQCIQKWTILRKDFSIPGGELGATMKLKRPEVVRMYAATIESLYAEVVENGSAVNHST